MEPTEHFGIYFGYIRRLFQSWVSPFNVKVIDDVTCDVKVKMFDFSCLIKLAALSWPQNIDVTGIVPPNIRAEFRLIVKMLDLVQNHSVFNKVCM